MIGKTIISILTLILSPFAQKNDGSKTMEVRVTYYHSGEVGGSTLPRGGKPKAFKTVAVDPKIIPYGSKIKVPGIENELVAEDTGGAVKRRVAARRMGRDVPVIDVFVGSRRNMKKMERTQPHFTKIKISSD